MSTNIFNLLTKVDTSNISISEEYSSDDFEIVAGQAVSTIEMNKPFGMFIGTFESTSLTFQNNTEYTLGRYNALTESEGTLAPGGSVTVTVVSGSGYSTSAPRWIIWAPSS